MGRAQFAQPELCKQERKNHYQVLAAIQQREKKCTLIARLIFSTTSTHSISMIWMNNLEVKNGVPES